MKNGVKLALGLGTVTTSAMIFTVIERSKQTMSLEKNIKVEDLGDDNNMAAEGGITAGALLPVEEEKIANYIKGMSDAELLVVVRNLPADAMMYEIVSRLDSYKRFAESVQDAAGYLPK